MNLINNNLFENINSFLQLIKLNENFSKIGNICDSNNNIFRESNNFVNESTFKMNLLKTNIHFKQILENKINAKVFEYHSCFWPKCEHKTKTLTDLEKHQLIHKNIKQFKCDFNNCNKLFTQKAHLFRHKFRHSSEKAFVCNYNETIRNHSLITISLTFIIQYFSTNPEYVNSLLAIQLSHFTSDIALTHTDHYVTALS